MAEPPGRPDRELSRRVLIALDAKSAEPAEVREALATFADEGATVTLATEAREALRWDGVGAAPEVDLDLADAKPLDYDFAVVVGNVSAMVRLLRDPVVRAIIEDLQASQWDRRLKASLLAVHRAGADAEGERDFGERVLEAFRDILPSRSVELSLYDPGERVLRLVAERGMPPDLLERIREIAVHPEPRGAAAVAVRERRLVHFRDVVNDSRARHLAPLLEKHGLREVAAAPLLDGDGEILGAVGVRTARSFSEVDLARLELVAVEVARELARLRLRERVNALARERGMALDRLRRAYAELEDFTYSVSHDLSEPLRGISTLAGYLHRDLAGKVGPEDEEMLWKVERSARQLKTMVSGLLEVSRAMRPPANEDVEPAEDVESREVLSDCVSTLAPRLDERRARLVMGPRLPRVRVDRHALDQVFLNLISNALKHSDKAEPLIEVGCDDVGNDWIFFVRDNGPGIPATFHDRIFRIYGRGPNAGEGAGIGLALVRKIVEREGGRVWVESVPGAGATFRVALPKNGVAEPPEGGGNVEDKRASSWRRRPRGMGPGRELQ